MCSFALTRGLHLLGGASCTLAMLQGICSKDLHQQRGGGGGVGCSRGEGRVVSKVFRGKNVPILAGLRLEPRSQYARGGKLIFVGFAI
jgi:hypothetical protein